MKKKSLYRLLLPLLGLFIIINDTWGGTYSLHIYYQPLREFSSLRQKLGETVGIAPFQDRRSDKEYIAHYTSPRRVSNYFKSDPFPLEKAIRDSLSQAFPRYGVKTVSVSEWSGKQESMKNIEADSILAVEIKRFWMEGITTRAKTKMNTSVYLVIHLGVKKVGKVFTRNVFIAKERAIARLTPEEVEQTFNQILTNIFDNFLSNPYEI